MPALARVETLETGMEVVVETTFGTYRGLLAQDYAKGSDVKLRCLGHDLWLHNRSVYGIRAAGQA
jgi:hypothetical protein